MDMYSECYIQNNDMYSGCYIQNMNIYSDFGNLGTNVAASLRSFIQHRKLPDVFLIANFLGERTYLEINKYKSLSGNYFNEAQRIKAKQSKAKENMQDMAQWTGVIIPYFHFVVV